MDCHRIITLLQEPLAKEGFELVDVVFCQTEGEPTLQVFVDCIGGVNLDKCQEANQIIDSILDQHNFIEERYFLEVSSPGIFRPLKEPRHYQRFIGNHVKVYLHQNTSNQEPCQGVLKHADAQQIQLKTGNQSQTFQYSQIRKAHLDPIFDF